jgi:uncharacterized membrane protein
LTLEPSAPARPARLPRLDAVRGIAILAMVVYHFSWDLRFFGFIATDIGGELGWRIFARLIAGTFLALVGINLVLAARVGFDRRRFLRRLAVIAAAAAAITAVTWFAMPEAYIFFGILHSIAVASVLGLPFVRAPVLLTIAAAVACFLAPALLSGPFFDRPALLWLGLATYFPQSNDYVPIFPWFGVVLAGIAAARLAPKLWPGYEAFLARPAPRPLLFAGRYSLPIYLLHQPILFGLVYAAAALFPPDMIGFEPSVRDQWTASCIESDMEEATCSRIVDCVVRRTQAEGLWRDLVRGAMSEEEIARFNSLRDECSAAEPAPGSSYPH